MLSICLLGSPCACVHAISSTVYPTRDVPYKAIYSYVAVQALKALKH